MLLDLTVVAVVLAIGNVVFRHFEPRMPLWRRVLKACVALTATAAISHYFGHTGVMIGFGIAALPVVYIHAIWLRVTA